MAGTARVIIGEREWLASVALLPWELTAGLGGLENLETGNGMLFDLGMTRAVQVTTEPMLFPIDIAFLNDELMITEVYRNTDPGFLISSGNPVRYFLEVNGGELNDVEPGNIACVEYLDTEGVSILTSAEISQVISIASLIMTGGLVAGLAKNFTSGVSGD